MLIGCLLSSAANCCLAGRFPPSHCRGRLFASRAVRPDNDKQVGRIHTSFRFQSHASPCKQGEGRVGIRGRQLDTIKAPANSQKPKNRLVRIRPGLYRPLVPAASLPYPSLASKGGHALSYVGLYHPSKHPRSLPGGHGSRPYRGERCASIARVRNEIGRRPCPQGCTAFP